ELDCSVHDFVMGLILPGYSFWHCGRRMAGIALAVAYPVLGLLFLAGLGHPPSNVAFRLLIGIHATSIVYQLFHWVDDLSLFARMGVTLAVLGLMGFVVYQIPWRFLGLSGLIWL